MAELRERVVVITGAGGIGSETALAFAREGCRVAVCDLRPDRLEEARERLEPHAADVLTMVADVSDERQVGEFVGAATECWGRVDVLVNNAGGQFPKPARDLSPRGWEAVIKNNLNGLFYMTLATANAAMIPAGRGRIVNVIANIARGFPGMVHTGAARAGVENMTKTLAVEWATHGIRVNACAPGTIRSSGTAQYGEGALELSRRATPVKRLGTVEEVSRLIVFLASDQNDFVTGSTYAIDGGGSLWGSVWPIEEPKSRS
jgi:NAD(P)-dependent dehydrogenase (short-subunit alcohol dehydrogenase family)